MGEHIDRRAIVLRFPPGGPDQVKKVLNEAKYVHRHHQSIRAEPWYRLSVWADPPRRGEDRLDVVQRLLVAAGMGGIRIEDERNRIVWLATAGDILDAGFRLAKDGDPYEAPEHYSIVLSEPDRELIARLLALFDRGSQMREEQ